MIREIEEATMNNAINNNNNSKNINKKIMQKETKSIKAHYSSDALHFFSYHWLVWFFASE